MSSEEIVILEEGRFGVLAGPPPEQGSGVCVLLLNAGFIHRSGPFRLHTRLARRLAASGHASLRFDAPGVGDSIARSDVPLVQTIRAAMDVLQFRHGYSRFVVGGLCSAADLGWQVALADARVCGLLSIDGLARKGWWYRFARLRRGLAKNPVAWLRALHRRVRPRPGPGMTDADLRDWPADGLERAQFAQLIERGVSMFFLFTGGASYFLHRRQFGETYGAASRSAAVAFEHWPLCDHTFFAAADRLRLIDSIDDWMGRHLRR